jgi:nucleoside-diphosphate-sugar epimerase
LNKPSSPTRHFEAAIHMVSPFHFNVTDTKNHLLEPAINGTTGILQAIKENAPTTKRVVVTSSFAAMTIAKYGEGASKTYSGADFNPITPAQTSLHPNYCYRPSKTSLRKQLGISSGTRTRISLSRLAIRRWFSALSRAP